MTGARTQAAPPAAAPNGVAALLAYSFDSMKPFCGPGTDAATSILSEAHAVTVVLGNALSARNDGAYPSRDVHLSKAVDAVGTMIALAAFLLEGSTDE